MEGAVIDDPATRAAVSHKPDTLGLPGLSVLVVGLARSGAGAASLLRRHGFAVRGLDRGARDGIPAAERLEREGVECRFGSEDPALIAGMDFVVASPGVPPENPCLLAARSAGLPVLGELEVASRFVTGPMLAVTGTNGKTTTATWLAHLLRSAGREVQLAGNIGLALSEVADHLTPATLTVLEVSSFQLECIEMFRPRAAVVLNVTPDHLDRYASVADYARAKARIFENQGEGDMGILNAADPGAMSLERFQHAAEAHFDGRGAVGHGAGMLDGKLTLFRAGTPSPVLPREQLALPGPHNLENGLAALAMTLPWDLDVARLARGLSDLPPLPHRLEPCGTIGGVRFVNDSKATNVDAMEKALQSFEAPIHLIAGGRDKKGDFESIRKLVHSKVRTLLLIGEAADRIRRAYPDVEAAQCSSLEEAVRVGRERAAPGDVVLLSPGCASYDMFRNYEHRGACFRDAVAALAGTGA